MKKLLLLAGIVVVAGIIGFTTWILLTRDKMMARSFEMIKSAVAEDLPANSDKDTVLSGFDEAIVKIRSGQADQAEIQTFLLTFRSCAKDQELDSLEVILLLEKIRKI